jgi:hypothetical protein
MNEGKDAFAERLARIEARKGKPAAAETAAEAPFVESAPPQRALAPAPRRKTPVLPIALLFVGAAAIGLFFEEIMGHLNGPQGAALAEMFARDKPSLLERSLESRMTDEELRAMDNNKWIDEQLKGTRSENSRLARMLLSN